jgi:hypothetical protein
MRKTKDAMGEVMKKAHIKESKDNQRELKKIMLKEGKTHYSVWIESYIDPKLFIQGKTFRRWYWAVSPEKAGEMGLAEALTEGHIDPKIHEIYVLEKPRKKKA